MKKNVKEYVKQSLWLIVILTNIIFWSNIYLDIKLKSQRLVYQVNELIINDKRINKEINKYIYADNQVTLLNIVNRTKVSNIYEKDFSKVVAFKRFNCDSGENVLEYSRQDDNVYYSEEATVKYQTKIKIPLVAIIKTYFMNEQYIVVNAEINDLPLPLNVSYLKYKHNCGVFADWNVKIQ